MENPYCMTQMAILTYQYRIKDQSTALKQSLMSLSSKVNYVWNYINGLQQQLLAKNQAGYPFHYWWNQTEFDAMTAGSSKLLKLPAQTIQAITKEYAIRRKQFNQPFLKFRTNKNNRSLPWIPFKAQDIKLNEKGTFTFCGLKLKTWYSRPIPVGVKVTNGSLVRDSVGHWYINITFKQTLTEEQVLLQTSAGQNQVGIDIGLNPFMTLCSQSPDGSLTYEEIQPQRHYRQLESQLKIAQRANRKTRTKKIHQKIKNQRKDYLYKLSHQLVKDNALIVMGLIDVKRLVQSNLKGHAKSWHDNGYGLFKTMLKHKAVKHNTVYQEVSEKALKSTQSCSDCGQITGPKGLQGLGVSQWQCVKCQSMHLRNQNSAKNHLQAGQHSIECLKDGDSAHTDGIDDPGTRVLVERGITLL